MTLVGMVLLRILRLVGKRGKHRADERRHNVCERHTAAMDQTATDW
jgi:hypothetical protein